MVGVHWPGIQNTFARKRAAYTICDKCAPSQPAAELVCSENLTQYGRKFLIIIDRHSAWSSVYNVGKKEGAQGLTSVLNTNHTTFGIRMEIASENPATDFETLLLFTIYCPSLLKFTV